MKRELAALEAGLLVLDSIGRKTRSSKQIACLDSNGVSDGLVYKRVKRSVQVMEIDLLSNSSNGVVKDLKDHNMQKEVGSIPDESEERANGATCDERVEIEASIRVNGEERETGVESTCDEGVEKVGESSSMEVEQKVIDGNSLDVVGIKEVKISTKDEEAVIDFSKEDNGLVENVQTDKEVNNLSMEEQILMPNLELRDASSTGAANPVIINAVNADDVVIEIDKDRVLERSLMTSPSTMANGKEKNSSVERYPRRFTRSALKSDVMQNEENANEGTSSQTHLTENNGELKNSSVESHPRRLTRSSLNPKVDVMDSSLMEVSDSVVADKENTEPVMSDENADTDVDKIVEESMLATPKRKMEMKMSKQIALAKIPTTVKELLETGLLEGCPVYYNGGKGPGLRGRIRGFGILCTCRLCQGCKVIPPSLFEIHASDAYKRAAQYIYLENGRSFIQILKACKSTRLSTLEATVLNAIGPLSEKKLIVCQNCKEPFSTMDAESSEAVCSSCVVSNASPIGPVFSYRRLCRSSNSVCPLRPSQAAASCDVLPDRIQEKSIEKSSESVCPLKPSEAVSAFDGHPDSNQKKSIRKSPEAFFTPKLRSSPRFGKSSEAKTANKIEKSREVFMAPKTSSSPSIGKSTETKTCEKLINPQEVSVPPKTCSRSMRQSSLTKSCENIMKKSSKAALSPKLSGSTRVGKSSPANGGGKTTKRLRKEVLTPKPLKSPSVGCSSEKKTSGKITRKDLRMHKVVFEDDFLPDGTELGYYVRGEKLLDGYKKGSGIFCSCCETVVSASQFEAHAGCASRRKPYCYIYTSNGISLHELSINLIKGRTHSTKFNDDLCSICADGGNLVLCDGCPRAFHMECASLSSLPRGKYYCKYCQNMFEREKFVAHNANAVAAGRVSGVDPMEQITTRSIRIVDTLASELSSCILCRGYDFCKSGFGPRTIILCDQCEKEYHVGCLKDHSMADLTELPDGKWFCSMDCGRIESALQNLLVQGDGKLPESLVDTILKKHMEKGSEFATDFDVSWRLLSGKIASPETRPLLSQAVAIFHESFSPIIDAVSGQDLIAAMVYGRSVAGQEYAGMYCAVLTVNSVVVSAGIFRVFGLEVAELPLVATSTGNQGKGYFQALFACIEKLLAVLGVKNLVLPAALEAESIWTDRFGFTKMTPDQLREFKRNYWSVLRFQGTSMLQKSVPECRIIQSRAEFGFP